MYCNELVKYIPYGNGCLEPPKGLCVICLNTNYQIQRIVIIVLTGFGEVSIVIKVTDHTSYANLAQHIFESMSGSSIIIRLT